MSRQFSRPVAGALSVCLAAIVLQANVAAASLRMPQKTKLVLSDSGADDQQFGTAVAIDGNTAVVGAPFTDVGLNGNQGAVTVYVRGSNGLWSLQALLLAPDGAGGDQFGASVALQGDTLLVGAPKAAGPASADQGAVYVFTRTNNVWAQTARLTSGADGDADENFGFAVAIDGDTAVIGAPGYFSFTGAAWIFTRAGTTWTIGPRLMASDPDTFHQVALSVAISGDTALLGAPVSGAGTASGAVYVFTRNGATWSEQVKLTATPGNAFGWFGNGVALQQNTALIGAPCPSSGCRGAAYIFTRTGTTWTQQATLTPSDSVGGDTFGWSVALAGQVALISGQSGPPGNFAGPGEVHLYTESGGSWSEQATMRASDGAARDRLGASVALNRLVGLELTAIAGAPRNNILHGGAYIFANLPPTLTLVPDQTTAEDVPLRIPFTIADGETPNDNLTLQASATDNGPPIVLLPDANFSFEGTGTSRTLVLTPAANFSGQATVRLSASDDYFTVTTSFRVTVTPVDDPPTVSAIANQTTTAGTPTAAIPFTIGDVDTPIASLIVSATSSNSALVPPANIAIGGGTGAARTITVTPTPQAHGTTTITVLVDDGTTHTSRDFTLTVPDPARTYYLAEGSTGAFFDTDLLLANPNDSPVSITIAFFKGDGGSITHDRTLPPLSRTTIPVDEISGMEATSFSTAVTSPTGLPIVVERTMRWDASGYGAHGEKATEGAALRWYFAEGSQGYFSTFFLLVNPSSTANSAHVTYYREGETPLQRDYALPPASRVTIDAGADAELVNRSFGALVVFDQPGAAERAMYFGRDPLWSGGHDSAGVEAPSTSWFLAEGATGTFFNTFVLLANPNADDATATLTYFPATGTPVTRQRTVPAGRRVTINLAEEDPSLASAAISTRVESTLPIIVERSQYWPAPDWYEGHNSFGVTATGTHWGLAEGRVGGPAAYQTYILLANPGTLAATVTVRFLRTSGAPLIKTFSVPPAQRFNIAVTGDPHGDAPELTDEAFGAAIESTQPIVVERAMYSNANGVIWAAGTGATATRLP